jgi:ketosteroid isomerase-like protein
VTDGSTETGEIAPLERLLIVQACSELIARFAERIDARDADALAAMFVEDGSFARPTAPDAPVRGREAIREQFRARPANKLTRHIVANTIVTVKSAVEATAQSTILLFTATLAEGAKLPVKTDAKQLLGAYEDVLVRDRDGVWKFKERRGSLAMTIEP